MAGSINSPELKTLQRVVGRLEKASIPYMLTGSMALNFYGHPRATNDFDIVIEIQKHNAREIFSLFQGDYYITEEAIQEALDREGIFNIIDQETIFKVDLIVKKRDPFSIEQFKRRRPKEIEGLHTYVIAPEDLILAKLQWSRESFSDTPDEVQRIFDQQIRRLSEQERFLRGLSLTHFCRQACLAGILGRKASLSPQEIKLELFERIYGDLFTPREKEKIRAFLK